MWRRAARGGGGRLSGSGRLGSGWERRSVALASWGRSRSLSAGRKCCCHLATMVCEDRRSMQIARWVLEGREREGGHQEDDGGTKMRMEDDAEPEPEAEGQSPERALFPLLCVCVCVCQCLRLSLFVCSCGGLTIRQNGRPCFSVGFRLEGGTGQPTTAQEQTVM